VQARDWYCLEWVYSHYSTAASPSVARRRISGLLALDVPVLQMEISIKSPLNENQIKIFLKARWILKIRNSIHSQPLVWFFLSRKFQQTENLKL
jgi:hypothetical protein